MSVSIPSSRPKSMTMLIAETAMATAERIERLRFLNMFLNTSFGRFVIIVAFSYWCLRQEGISILSERLMGIIDTIMERVIPETKVMMNDLRFHVPLITL